MTENEQLIADLKKLQEHMGNDCLEKLLQVLGMVAPNTTVRDIILATKED